jgi:hypothetical protein
MEQQAQLPSRWMIPPIMEQLKAKVALFSIYIYFILISYFWLTRYVGEKRGIMEPIFATCALPPCRLRGTRAFQPRIRPLV